MTNCGCSFGIRYPESGTVTPVTFEAKACVELSTSSLGNHQLMPIQALLSALADSLFCTHLQGKARKCSNCAIQQVLYRDLQIHLSYVYF
jgi:hypothetical protein